ncbi:glycosyltransferase family 4 protein [Tsukamurella strandjordii]|uniref:glycosyltransferase family 4 protein n=1 Tax=Tsukamurella strandjordii TaxID=147577 RepID=UPI0031E2C464
MNEPLRVLLVGPAPPGPDSRGGMATVMGHMAAHPGARITVVPTYVDGTPAERLRVGVTGMLRAAALVLLGRVDVLHVHLSHGGSVVRKAVPLWAARLRGVPAVVHGHSFDFGGWMQRLPAPAQAVVRAALPADEWLVLSTGLAEEYRAALRLPADRVRVLHNPVPSGSVAAPDPRGAEVLQVVSLGRLGERKGSYDLVRAVAQLPPEVAAQLHLTLAGDGEVEQVRAAVADAGVGATVTVRGWVDAAERDRLLAASHVFALPSYHEGLPMALLEAMAAGLAPLATGVGGIPDAIADGADGVLVQPGDTAALAAALTAMVRDRETTAELAAAARERADDFDIESWYETLGQRWNALLPVRPARRG